MMGFTAFLMLVFIGGFIVLLVQGLRNKRPFPLPTEFTAQMVGQSAADEVVRQTLPTYKAAKAPNSHWYQHTFNRNRKVKR